MAKSPGAAMGSLVRTPGMNHQVSSSALLENYRERSAGAKSPERVARVVARDGGDMTRFLKHC